MEEKELNAEQKLVKSMLKLRTLRPFYSAIYESMKKEKSTSEDIKTMAVSLDTIYYNEEFIEKSALSEIIYSSLHEIGHIALMHIARRQNRDPLLWNMACDLYINKALFKEFDLTLGRAKLVKGMVEVLPPNGILYCNSLDVDKDYVEKIYDEFEQQAKQNEYFSGKPGVYHFEYKGSGKDTSMNWNPQYNKTESKFEINIELKDGKPSYNGDLVDEGLDQNQKEFQARKIVSDAKVRSEMQSNGIGDKKGCIERLVENLLKSKLDWKKLFRKYLVEMTSSDSSFSIPDKRMYYQKAIYPGQSKEESNHINGVKICIDTSGSISETDMKRFFYQVIDILKKYKVDAELIYWDAEVQSAGNMKNISEFKRVQCYGGGGTNPGVLFDRFKKKKEKPRAILVFTDGYFYTDWADSEYKKKYKDTIWIMTKNYDKDFKPPFGKLAIPDFEG